MMRLNAYTWFRAEMKSLTMDQKRDRINLCIENILNDAHECGCEYGSVAKLKENICLIMDWVSGTCDNGYTGWKRKVWIAADINNPKVDRTIENMVSKGIIKLSKSGKGFTK